MEKQTATKARLYGEYGQYRWVPEYEGLPCTYGAFGIIPGRVENCPAVYIKQRNGKGPSPYLFDLPGGRMEPEDQNDLRKTVVRELFEELRVRCQVVAAIGGPLYLPIIEKNVRVRVDCAQAFLVQTSDTPQTTEEALAIACVHEKSFMSFDVVGHSQYPPRNFGRTPRMTFDGLSIQQKPFWAGPLTDDLRESIIGNPDSSDFLLLDGGVYLGRTSDGGKHIALYRRLNPYQPDGYYHGVFDKLAT